MALTTTQLRRRYALLVSIFGALSMLSDQAMARSHRSSTQSRKHALPDMVISSNEQATLLQAQKVYDLLKTGDSKAAVIHAEQGLKKSPQHQNLGMAYANALFADGRFEDADSVVTKLIERLGVDDRLLVLQASIRRQLADAATNHLYLELEKHDLIAAIRFAKQTVMYAPDLMAYRLVLMDLLMQNQQFAAADVVASEAVAVDRDDVMPLLLRGLIRQQMGQRAAAVVDFSAVLQRDDLPLQEEKNYRLIIADAALAVGDAKSVLDVLHPLQGREKANPMVLWRQRFAQAMLAGNPQTMAIPAHPFTLDCHASAYGRVCAFSPANAVEDPAYTAATQAYKFAATKDASAALAQARQAVRLDPDNTSYQSLLLNLLIAQGQLEEADGIVSDVIERGTPTAALLAQRGDIRTKLGKKTLANDDFSAALKLDTLPLSETLSLQTRLGRKADARATLDKAVNAGERVAANDLDLAYLALSVGDDKRAAEAFAKSDKTNPLSAAGLQDAAYTTTRTSQDVQALAYWIRSADAIFYKPLELRNSTEIKSLLAARSNIAQLSREWGASASLSYRGAASALGSGATSTATNDSIQLGAEVYWRPLGYQNGRLLEVYARAFETPYSRAGGLTGSTSLLGVIGLRWKPWSAQNLVFSVNRLFPVGSQVASDVLANISYFNGVGGELRTEEPSWWTQQYYAEVGRYFQHPQNYAVANAKVGRSYRLDSISPDLVAFPHAVLAGEYSDAYAKRSAVGLGPGINFRYWYRQNAYNAHRSYFDVSLQYRAKLAGDELRAKGAFLTLLTSY
jgi:bacteriophage N4 adsorption protein A